MKKLFSLVLVLTLVLSLGAIAVSANQAGTPDPNTGSGTGAGTSGLVLEEEDGKLSGTAADVGILHLGAGAISYVFHSDGLEDIDGNKLVYAEGTNAGKPYQFTGSTTTESVSYGVSHETDSGAKSGIPTGINGEDLLHIRLHFDDTTKSYILTVTPVANPTVEIFRNVKINVKVVIVAATKQVNNKYKAVRFTFTGLAFDPFKVQNYRYTSDDVWKDATGVWKINASSKYPVVDAGAFSKAYGGKLIVDYPDYRVIFPAVKNQDVALNLQAQIKGISTIALKDTDAILTATFHDIYVKDKVQIEFKVKADAQNYKGVTLYAYELDSNGKPIKAKEVKVVVSASATIVVEIPANTRLASVGEVAAATYGIFSTPQEGTGTGTKDPDTNPTSGPSDSVSVATAFAVISLAAAGFVAVGKAGKR